MNRIVMSWLVVLMTVVGCSGSSECVEREAVAAREGLKDAQRKYYLTVDMTKEECLKFPACKEALYP